MRITNRIAVLAIGLLAFMSCNKDYTCNCEGIDGAKSYTFLNAKKSTAESDCDLLNVDYTANGGSCDFLE